MYSDINHTTSWDTIYSLGKLQYKHQWKFIRVYHCVLICSPRRVFTTDGSSLLAEQSTLLQCCQGRLIAMNENPKSHQLQTVNVCFPLSSQSCTGWWSEGCFPKWRLRDPEPSILWAWWMGEDTEKPGRGAMLHCHHTHSIGHLVTCPLLEVTRIGKWG